MMLWNERGGKLENFTKPLSVKVLYFVRKNSIEKLGGGRLILKNIYPIINIEILCRLKKETFLLKMLDFELDYYCTQYVSSFIQQHLIKKCMIVANLKTFLKKKLQLYMCEEKKIVQYIHGHPVKISLNFLLKKKK